MNKKERKLRKLIKEEARKVLSEGVSPQDIEEAFHEAEEEVEEAEERLQQAKEEYRRARAEAGKKAKRLMSEFNYRIDKGIKDYFNISRMDVNPEGLSEYFIDGGRAKISIHNRKMFQKPDNPVTVMIRNEKNTREQIKFEIPDRMEAREVVAEIYNKVREFESEYATFIEWFDK